MMRAASQARGLVPKFAHSWNKWCSKKREAKKHALLVVNLSHQNQLLMQQLIFL
jgi:hypothetical protein